MSSEPTIPPVIGAIADDRDGTRIGIVAEVFIDDATGTTTWLAITDGLHSTRTLLAPTAGAITRTGRVRLAVNADAIAAAPRFPQSQHLGPAQESALRRHYGLPLPGGHQDTAPPTADVPVPTAATAGPTADTPEPTATSPARTSQLEVIRSEEQLRIGTAVVPYRKAVLRVETTTEEVLVPVTITRQHARVEYIDIDSTTAPPISPDLLIGDRVTGATSAWLTLTVEEPVISTRAVPVERVRLVTEWVTDTHGIRAQLAHEVVTESTVDTTTPDSPRPPV